jgi:hypothetical protein
MKKVIILFLFSLVSSVLFAGTEGSNDSIFVYIPQENEIQFYMNLYEKLKNIENNKMDSNALVSYYDTFLKQQKYRETYQSLLFESYLLNTQNENVKKIILAHIKELKYNDEFSKALIRLYASKKEKVVLDKKEELHYNYQNKYFDENIDLFHMKEINTFNNELGIMFFDQNSWKNIIIKDKNQEKNDITFICGGGTNSISLSLEKHNIPDSLNFFKYVDKSKFYKEKYKNFKLNELPTQGVLSRSGADKINIGIGYGKDQIPEIESFTVILYMYSKNKKCGYVITYYMNFSKINNNYEFRNRIYNHLIYQILLSWMNT